MSKPDFSNIIVTQLCAVGRVNFRNLTTGSCAQRPFNAMYLKLAGNTTYSSQGVTYVSDPNHIVFLPKGSSYQVNFLEYGACFRLEFDSKLEEDSTILSIPIHQATFFINSMLRMENLWIFKKPGYLPRCMAALYSILSQLDELTNASYVPSSKFNLISGGLFYLEANYANPELTMQDLAEAAGISEVYFRRVFSEVYHTPPSHYLRNVRIEKAKDMLTSDFSSVDEIAHSVGFSSIYHFSKSFRQLTGQSPSEYAKMIRQDNSPLLL